MIYPPLNLSQATKHLRRDPKLAPLIARHGRAAFAPDPNAFRELTRSIIHQQLSGRAASAIFDHFLDLFPQRKFPTPSQVLITSLKQLRQAGLSNQKAAYVLDLAQKFSEGTLQPRRFKYMSDAEISEHLIQVKGIGQWTADMFLMFALNRPDVLPTGDLGIRNGFRKIFGLRQEPTPEKMIALAEPWRPYRTVASWYVWRVLEE